MAGYIGSRASVVSSGAERKKTFDITTTTTVLTGLSYTPTFVHLFHNGVRLVDGTDYTATNGESITLTTAAENGDQVVVVSYATFQAADAYTKAEADAGFVSDPNGAVTVDGSGSVGIGTSSPTALGTNIKTLEIKGGATDRTGGLRLTSSDASVDGYVFGSAGVFRAGTETATPFALFTTGTERMLIDTAGRVTMPYQPAFRAYQFIPRDGAGTIIYSQTGHNIGSHYNTATGIFTAPIAGVYHFDFSILMKADASVAYIRVLFKVNGSTATTLGDTLTGGLAGIFTNWNYHSPSMSHSFYLNANDTVAVHNDSPHSTYQSGGYGSFSGYLVG